MNRLARVLLNFRAYSSDCPSEDALDGGVFWPPDQREQVLAFNRLTHGISQGDDQLELCLGEVDFFTVYLHLPALNIDHEIAMLENLVMDLVLAVGVRST